MDAIYFYWFSWIGWIIVTFFWDKSKNQFLLGNFILILIMSASLHIDFFSFQITGSYIALLFFSSFLLSKVRKRRLLYYLVISLAIVGLSTGFRLFFIFDPVMVLFDPAWMLSIITFLLVVSIVKDGKYRIPLLITGLCQGELVMSLFLYNIYGTQIIGEPFILDVIIITVVLLYLWQLFEQLTIRLSFTVKKMSKPI